MSIFGRLAALVPGGQAVAAVDFFAEHWKTILTVALTVVVLAGTFWAGGMAPRAQLVAQAAKAAQEVAEREAEDGADVAASSIYVATLEEEYEEKLKAVDAAWHAYAASLSNGPGGKPPSQSVQPRPQVCTDSAGNDRLSDALAGFREEIRAVVADERAAARASREDAGRLLAVCHRQALEQDETVQWVLHEQTLWNDDGPIKLQ